MHADEDFARRLQAQEQLIAKQERRAREQMRLAAELSAYAGVSTLLQWQDVSLSLGLKLGLGTYKHIVFRLCPDCCTYLAAQQMASLVQSVCAVGEQVITLHVRAP